MRTLRFGIIGAGWPGQQHAKAIAAIPGTELRACSDTNDERLQAFRHEFSPMTTFAEYHELLADGEIDAVIICLPNFLHFPASLAALEAGKHVLCEKPPTLNAAEMKVLRDAAAKRNLVYFFGRQFRFAPALRTAREIISEGKLGTIYRARATWVRSRGIPPGVDSWFTDKKRSGGGALIDIGVHALDSAWFLMGTPRPVSISAKVFRNFAHFVNAPVFNVEDEAHAFIRFANGSIIELETSWAANLTDDTPVGPEWVGRESNNCVLFGTKATLRLRPFTLFEDQNGKLVTVPLQSEYTDNSFEMQLRNFADAIRGDAAPINNAEQAFQLMEMIDGIYASSELGREVPVA
ncbi:MAG: Gfo/Idh/MocA family oxidoreductase [Verrucomicrobia bacterium]|nr:Gfo/Idh/MocA family oxidoreductase [Verrucomicrobiota bacterium]